MIAKICRPYFYNHFYNMKLQIARAKSKITVISIPSQHINIQENDHYTPLDIAH